jgi:integrase
MAVRQDRGRWCVEFQQRGRRVFKRLPAGITKAQAQEWETRQRRGLFDRDELGHQEDLTLAGAIGLWLLDNRRKNKRKAESEARQWEPFTAGKLLRQAPEIASEAAQKWRRPRLADEGRPPTLATIDRRLAMLKAVAKHCWKKGLIDMNASGRIAMFNPPNAREVYLSKAEVRRLASKMPIEGGAAAVILLAYTGLRVSELLIQPKARPRQTSFALSARSTKSSKPRVVPIPAAAQPYLKALPLPFDYWRFHDAFAKARIAAGLPHVRPHDLRHTCASWLINEDVDLYTVATILGDDIQSAKRYAHLADRTLKRAMARLK